MKIIKNIYKLLKIIKEIYLYLILAIIFGVLGFLCSIFIPTIPIYYLLHDGSSFVLLIVVLISLPIMRGFFKYAEQWCNHYVAFSSLAIIRNKIFQKIANYKMPKIEQIDRGDLLNMITNDVEMLEVFYAHTITPIFIAIITNGIVLFLLFKINVLLGMLGLISYIMIGILIPWLFAKKLTNTGTNNRLLLSKLNNLINQSFLGIYEIKYLKIKTNYLNQINKCSNEINKIEENIQKNNALIQMMTTLIINITMLLYILIMFKYNILSSNAIIGFVLLASSFAPVIALANLGSGLTNTIASAKRVLNLLEQKEEIILKKEKLENENLPIDVVKLSYNYNEQKVLNNINLKLNQNIIGIFGKSGSGKTTLLKILMGYYEDYQGNVFIQKKELKNINQQDINNNQGYLEQDTYIFNTTILNNIKIAKKNATIEEVILACKKANIYEFINNLEDKFETIVSNEETILSAGERQRIGLARIFLAKKRNLLLDEPTSNLDALNEGLVLQSIMREQKEKNIIIVSHRLSTLNICKTIMEIRKGELCE